MPRGEGRGGEGTGEGWGLLGRGGEGMGLLGRGPGGDVLMWTAGEGMGLGRPRLREGGAVGE